ncbi:MAG: hypothetical protein LBH62_02455 [Nitrososphaerota archaeon]|nr:hypothetical protein [Nitrososphaerota archaeon]
MVKFILEEERQSLSREELKSLYIGKFVFLTNVKFTEFMGLVEGIPVIVADSAYEDVEKGIYKEFYNEETYGVVFGYDLVQYPRLGFGGFGN